jgi:fructose-bisphosphate aldolase class II
MLVNLKEILDIAVKGNFAVPAFNTYNLETVMGVTEAAEELKAPVILQCYSRLSNSDYGYYLAPVILAAARKAKVPVCFHLDHGVTELEVIRGIRYGCSGIMIDASKLPLYDNIKMTGRICALCSNASIPVEGELGHVGTVNDASMSEFTDIGEAVKFVEETKVAALAIMVGTAHGRYKKAPRLDIERIAKIKEALDKNTSAALVLHGGSGIPDDQIKAAINAGIRKINFGTDICYSFLDKVFETPRDVVAIDLFMKGPIENVKKFAAEKIKLLGADDKA